MTITTMSFGRAPGAREEGGCCVRVAAHAVVTTRTHTATRKNLHREEWEEGERWRFSGLLRVYGFINKCPADHRLQDRRLQDIERCLGHDVGGKDDEIRELAGLDRPGFFFHVRRVRGV